MPKAKQKTLLNNFPALTRVLLEIAQHRERERIQPRLPFEQHSPDPKIKSPVDGKK